MYYEGELQLLCSTFKKNRVDARRIDVGEGMNGIFNESFSLLFGEVTAEAADGFLKDIKPDTVYRLNTPFFLSYIFLLLPSSSHKSVLAIGPYLPFPPDSERIFGLGEKYGIPPHRHTLLENYYAGIPHVSENSSLFTLLDAFAERLWGEGGYTVTDADGAFLEDGVLEHTQTHSTPQDTLLQMKLMEERYAAENELMRAVTQGQAHKGAMILSAFAHLPFEKRLDDPLRNLKNYSIIMNTLLRKAAEQSGVHPLHLDRISSGFAVRIEQLMSVSAVHGIMIEMYRAYCRLVKSHNMKSYSPTVQKAAMLIESDLSADISLRTLAEALSISPPYLSTIFKKETGKTVTDYINGERMSLAAHLLKTTRLQIQSVALHCGMPDVHYFSKLFKKHLGKTPKKFREET